MRKNVRLSARLQLSVARAAVGPLAAAAVFALVAPAVALAYPGQTLLEYGRNFIIAPLGLFAIVVGVGGAMFKPDLVKGAIWTAVICAFLFAIISGAPAIMSALQNS
ncbi:MULTISPECIES: hypothetical protein [Anaeromyxobacter]|uniref:hypothetical protein n=1 Tax=Anaeromyxobacter TaxID=161492 RepID=UPI001F59F9CB|nr:MULTISPECIES: hypothetical protein [unclassified Anaeromyxobacter]